MRLFAVVILNITTMAFITKWTASKLLSSFNLDSLEGEKLYKMKTSHLFTKLDETRLKALRSLYMSDSAFLNMYRKPQVEKDNYDLLYSWANSFKYHEDSDCPYLNSDFVNYVIPKSVKDKGRDYVWRFRHWFNANIRLIETNKSLFCQKLFVIYGVTFNELIPIKVTNSGIYQIENLSPRELEDKIDRLILQANKFYFDECNNPILVKMGKRARTLMAADHLEGLPDGVNEDFAKEVLSDFETKYREPLHHYFEEFFRIKYNPELSFDKKVLDQLGLVPCKNCCNKNKSVEIVKIEENLNKKKAIQLTLDPYKLRNDDDLVTFPIYKIQGEYYISIEYPIDINDENSRTEDTFFKLNTNLDCAFLLPSPKNHLSFKENASSECFITNT